VINDPDPGLARHEAVEGDDPTDQAAADDQVADQGADDPVAEQANDDAPADPFDAEAQEALDRLRSNAQDRGERADANRSFWRELPLLIVVALVVAVLIKTFLVQAFYIPSASMADTLVEGDRVMVNKLAYRFGDPDHGDVIVFDNPRGTDNGGESILGAVLRHIGESLGVSSPDSALIKRVVAIEGETLEIRDNQVFIDGAAQSEPFVRDGSNMADFGPVDVPENHVFVMGDNRGQSQDSRSFGPIPESDIIGKAFIKVWPPGRWGGL
jgi:signal peptidase I